jgi:redox-sensitive bicupin YhaK (pirin superfamily)
VNLPSAHKMDKPRYQDVPAASILEVRRDDGTVVRVVAGSVDGVEGPVREIVAEPEYLDVSLPAGGCFTQPVPRGHSAFAYVFEGEGRFGVTGDGGYRAEGAGVLAAAPRLLLFADGDEVRDETDGQPARFLLVSGKPLGEPIARYGPFVMTTRAEIEQALRDLRGDQFVWRDDAEWLRMRQAPPG